MNKLIIFLVVSLLSTFGIVNLYYEFVGRPNVLKFRNIIIFLLGVVLLAIVRYCDMVVFGSIFYFIFFPVMFYFIYFNTFKELSFYLFLIWVYGMFLDLISMVIVSLIHFGFHINVYNYYAYKVMPTIIVFVLFILISKIDWFKKINQKLFKKIETISYVDIILFIFSVFVLTLSIAFAFNITNINIGLLLVIIVLLVTILFFFLIKYKLNSIENDIFLDNLKANNDFYINMNDEIRIFKHNIIAKILCIKSVSNSKARILINDLLSEFNKNVDFSNHIKEIPYGLNGIVYEKIYPYLNNLNIKIDNKINYDIFDFLKARRYNVFVEKIVIALDNAIEASLSSFEKLLVINLYENDVDIIAEIKNSFSQNINVDNLGNKNYSTKNTFRGLGLFSAFRDKEAILSIKIVNDMFVCKISVKKNK